MGGCMEWVDLIPGSILGLREGLEAFLIIGIMMKYLQKTGRGDLTGSVKLGLTIGVGGSLVLGLVFWVIIGLLEGSSDNVGKLWESIASIAGLGLLTTFIFWMMKHGKTVVTDIHEQVAAKVSAAGITSLAAVVVLREGVEISLFAFSSVNQLPYVIGIGVGVIVSAVLAYLFYRSLVRLNLSMLFNLTLAYLVLQAGYLLGYSIHEFLSAMKGLGRIASDSGIYIKAFNFADTVLDHKSGAIGIPLNVLIGWYSRPEWIQLVLHYGYVLAMFLVWRSTLSRFAASKDAARNDRQPADHKQREKS
jgi:high-affinity iron transporter